MPSTIFIYMKESERESVESHTTFGSTLATGMLPRVRLTEHAIAAIRLMAAMHIAKVPDSEVAGNEVEIVYLPNDDKFPINRVGLVVLASPEMPS